MYEIKWDCHAQTRGFLGKKKNTRRRCFNANNNMILSSLTVESGNWVY